MKDGAVAIHEDHRGGKIKETRGQDEVIVGEVVGLTDHETVDVEMESRGVEHNQAVEEEGDDGAY